MGKPVLSTPESEINCFAKLVDKQDCPRSSDIHYGLTMKYQVVEPLRSSSSSSSSSSSHPSPSTFHSFSPTSNFILVIHGAPECPRESYFKHSGTLEAFNIGDVHKLRLKRKLNRTPSPFDKLVDPYESDPCQRYISLRVEPASQPILRNRSIFETLRLALRGRSLQFRFDETTQEGMEDDPELGARGHGFHFQSQQRGRDNNNNNSNEDNNNEEDDFDIRFFSSNRFDLAQMVQSILGRQISPPRSSLFGRDFAIGPLSLNEDLEDDNEDDDEDLEDEEQLREPLVGLDPMDDEDLSLFEGDDDEEDEEYDEEQDQGDEYDDDDDHGHAMDEEEEEELHPPRQLFSSLVHRQISLDDDSEDEAEDDEYDEERDESHGSRRAEDQNRRREGGGGGGGNGPQSASQRSYPYFHSTYF